MVQLIQELQKEWEYLRKLRQRTEADLKSREKIPGKLRIQRKGGSLQYYQSLTEQKPVKNIYIPKQNMELARNLAQRDYDQKLLKEIIRKEEMIEGFLEKYGENNLEMLYEAMNDYRKGLINPMIEAEDQYREKWLAVPYIKKEIGEEVPEIFTENGERVRSKSEKMIADKLRQLQVPYRYEAPLRLDRIVTIHPDFTVLNIKKRKEFYFEHFGMMDCPEYAQNAIKRIYTYEKNEIFLGESLLCSWETKAHPLDMQAVDGMIRKYLLS